LKQFFEYQSPYRTDVFLDLNIYEKLIPILIIVVLGVLLFKYREVFQKDNKLDKITRYSVGVLLLIVYSSHYILRFSLYGFDTIVLPFHLCSIAMFFAIILLFTNNRTIFTFVMMTGIAGGAISLATPIIGYNSEYYRYYQFYIAHGILVLVPFYYLFVKHYIPSGKEIKYSFYILQAIATFMMVFNYYMNTDFMFLFFDPSKIDKFPLIALFGGIPYYIILVEITAIAYFYVTSLLVRFIDIEQGNIEFHSHKEVM
jgi:hypothetical integral membrane protein (TIGR02206 family)